MRLIRGFVAGVVALGCFSAAAAAQQPADTDTVAAKVTFARLLPGAMLGSALGLVAGYGGGVAFHDATGCCWDGGDDPGLAEGLVGAVLGGVVGSATGAWLSHGRKPGRPSLGKLLPGALIGAAGGLALAAAGARLGDAIDSDLPGAGAVIGFAVGQGLVTAWAGALLPDP